MDDFFSIINSKNQLKLLKQTMYLNYDFFFRGAQVDVRNKKGNSSLWLAANGGHLDVVQLLHSAGADIDSQDNRKVSCLMAAFRKGHSKVVKWMVKHVSQFPSDTELTRYIATISGMIFFVIFMSSFFCEPKWSIL